jgi:HK97 gp10 family phage protein
MELEHVKGLRELSDALRQLPDRIARNALRQSVAAGAAVIRKDAQSRAPVASSPLPSGGPPPGTLKRSVVTRYARELSNQVSQTYTVGVRHGKKYRKQGKKGTLSQDAYYWRWVEFGTVKMRAQPFLRPAFEANKQLAVQVIAQYLAKRIPEEAATLPGAKP